MNKLFDKLTTLRKHYNYSQKHIARVLGVDVVTYMGFENGREVLNYDQMIKLSKFYHIDVSELFINDKKVTLYNVGRQDTDKLNIEYFIPKKNLWFKIKRFVRNNRLLSGIIIGVLAVLVIIFLLFEIFKKPVVNEIVNINTLSVSNKTVLYLNENGAVRGSGDNSKSQISNLPSSGVVKVLASDNYDLFLYNDGTLLASGEVPEFVNDACHKYRDVIDIALGSNHLLILDSSHSVHCLGSNEYKQCDLNGESRVEKIFAGENGSVIINSKGDSIYSGDFIGRSTINDVSNIVDIDFSDTSTIYVTSEGKVDYATNLNNKHLIEALGWSDIVDVACGHDFLVGLTSEGLVCVASDNELIKDEAKNLKNIISIDAGKDYFIAYDGDQIYGFGKNTYNQFISLVDYTSKLGAILNVRIESEGDEIKLSFDPVYNAKGYTVIFNGTVFEFENCKDLTFDAKDIEDNTTCTFIIKAKGDDYYKDSDEYKFDYVYIKDSGEKEAEESVTIRDDLFNLTKDELDAYLYQIGIKSIESIEEGECSDDRISIAELTGIMPGESYTKSQLDMIHVQYQYCKLKVEE